MKCILKLKVYIIGIFLLSILSCNKDSYRVQSDSILGMWRVESVKKVESETILIPEKTYKFEFKDNTQCEFNLDVNDCFTNYSVSEYNNNVSFDGGGCTYVCCDSDTANEIVNSLKKIESFSYMENQLNFKGNKVEIVLKRL